MEEKREVDIRTWVVLILDLMVVAIVSYAVLGMIFTRRNGVLVSGGWSAFKYYTVLSNVFCVFSCLAAIIHFIIGKGKADPSWLYVFRLMGSSVVSVTLLVVIFFLGPIYGYGMMFTGVSFWLHLVAPVAAIISQLLLKPGSQLPFRTSFWGIAPTAAYGIVYISVNAVGWTGASNPETDFYRFLYWGWGVGVAVFLGVFLINWLVSVLYWRLGRKAQEGT